MFFVIRGNKVWKAVRGVHRDIIVSVFLIYSVKMTAEKQDSLCLMHIHHCRRCIPQMMVIRRCFILKMQPLHFQHLHMNKTHWNSIILDGSVPDKDIRRIIGERYDLTKGKKK